MYNKKGGKVLGKGRDGCVTDKAILCSTKSNPKDYENFVSKVIDISDANFDDIKDFVSEFNSGQIFRNFDPNGNHFLPGLEMCYKKYHELNKEHQEDMKTCKYNNGDYNSLYLNILLRKGLSFQKITNKLKSEDFLKSLMYSLIGAKHCSQSLGILLLDIKRDNLLYKEESKDVVVPVFIDFSDDFVIKTPKDLSLFYLRFASYYNTWTVETMIIFIMNKFKLNKYHPSIKKIMTDLKHYRNIDLSKLMKEPSMKLLIDGLFNDILEGKASKLDYQNFCEKQMLYAIARSYSDSYFQSENVKDLRKYKIPELLGYLTSELYEERPSIDQAIDAILKILKNDFKTTIKKRSDYFIDLNKQDTPSPPKTPAKIYSNKDMLKLLKTLTSGSTTISEVKKAKSIIASVKSSKSNTLDKSLLKKISLMIISVENKKNKKSSKKLNKSSYKQKSKSLNKNQMLNKIKLYKNKNCSQKSIHLMKKSELIEQIIFFDKKQHKVILENMSYFKLKNLYKSLYEKKCKVNQNAKKEVLAKFIKDNNI